MSFINSHGGGFGLVTEIQRVCAHDLLVDESRLARRARALAAIVIHLVQAETFSGNAE